MKCYLITQTVKFERHYDMIYIFKVIVYNLICCNHVCFDYDPFRFGFGIRQNLLIRIIPTVFYTIYIFRYNGLVIKY